MSQKQRKAACTCGNDTFYFVKDLNLDKVWKAGNKFARICTDCGSRYFLSKAMWEASDDTYVILQGDERPVPLFECPACSESVTGTPETCPYCDAEFDWSHYEDPGAVEAPEDAEIEEPEREPEPESEPEPEPVEGDEEVDEDAPPEPSTEIRVEENDAEPEGPENAVPQPLRVHQHPDEIREMHYNEMKTLASDAGIPAVGKKAELIARIASVRLDGLDEDHDHYQAWVAASDPEKNN